MLAPGAYADVNVFDLEALGSQHPWFDNDFPNGAGRLKIGSRGYAATLAQAYQVSPRTVVSWVEKARARGILTATTPGVAGGTVPPRP